MKNLSRENIEKNISADVKQCLSVEASTYVDPNGFLFKHKEGLYRAIFPEQREFYQELFDNGTIESLQNKNNLVKSKITHLNTLDLDDHLVIEHEEIRPVTYCVEWCPEMLLDAAQQTLRLQLELIDRNLSLQDASPWNILFCGGKPVFIDFTSIVKQQKNLIWQAYDQFRSFFYWPLLLSKAGKGNLARLFLYDHIDGVGIDDFCQNVSPLYRLLHLGLLFEQQLNKLINSNNRLKVYLRSRIDTAKPEIPTRTRRLFIQRMEKKLSRIKFGRSDDKWSNYYTDLAKDGRLVKKTRIVEKIISGIKPKTVTDVGCNTGVFSIIAAKLAASVIAIDNSEAVIARLYKEVKRNNYNITPIVANITNPTPSFGFMGTQYLPLMQRIYADMVLCLGVMHHLHIRGRQSIDRIVNMLANISGKHLLFEYVDRKDENIFLIGTNRKIDYSLDSVCSALNKKFTIIDICDSDRETRKLILCSKK